MAYSIDQFFQEFIPQLIIGDDFQGVFGKKRWEKITRLSAHHGDELVEDLESLTQLPPSRSAGEWQNPKSFRRPFVDKINVDLSKIFPRVHLTSPERKSFMGFAYPLVVEQFSAKIAGIITNALGIKSIIDDAVPVAGELLVQSIEQFYYQGLTSWKVESVVDNLRFWDEKEFGEHLYKSSFSELEELTPFSRGHYIEDRTLAMTYCRVIERSYDGGRTTEVTVELGGPSNPEDCYVRRNFSWQNHGEFYRELSDKANKHAQEKVILAMPAAVDKVFRLEDLLEILTPKLAEQMRFVNGEKKIPPEKDESFQTELVGWFFTQYLPGVLSSLEDKNLNEASEQLTSVKHQNVAEWSNMNTFAGNVVHGIEERLERLFGSFKELPTEYAILGRQSYSEVSNWAEYLARERAKVHKSQPANFRIIPEIGRSIWGNALTLYLCRALKERKLDQIVEDIYSAEKYFGKVFDTEIEDTMRRAENNLGRFYPWEEGVERREASDYYISVLDETKKRKRDSRSPFIDAEVRKYIISKISAQILAQEAFVLPYVETLAQKLKSC